MNVKLSVGRSGDRFSQSPGDIIEVSDDEGKRMIAAGQCTCVDPPAKHKKRETAMQAAAKMSVSQVPKARGHRSKKEAR